MEQEAKPTLRMITGNPRCNFPRPRRRLGDSVPIILPAVDLILNGVSHEVELKAMGLTNWQVNRAWQIVGQEPDKAKYWHYRQAFNRTFLIWRVLTAALDHERREILAILQEHHPAMTKRIMASLQRKPKSNRNRRHRR